MTASEPSPSGAAPADEVAARWICFELAGAHYGIEILRTLEVLAEVMIEPIPGAAAGILGVANLRGRIVTVFDPSAGLGLPPPLSGLLHRFVVVDCHGEPVALRVDRLAGVRAIFSCAIAAAPASPDQPAVLGVVADRIPELILLDIDRLLAPLALAGTLKN